MKKNKTSNKVIALVAAAVVLFAGGTVTGTKAVLNIFSPEHFLAFETDSQFVQIQENGTDSSTLLTELSGKVLPGKEYKEQIRARNNTKDAPQFVRIIIRKYWKDAEGNKIKDLPKDEKGNYPDLDKIKLEFVNQDYWQRNDEETTAERQVYYYKDVVPVNGVTKDLTSTLTVDKSVVDEVSISDPVDNVITYTYKYNGYQVCLEAEAQSIQTHNAKDAVRSIWGVTKVTATDTTLTVVK